jgi:hypothetical protein
MAGRFDKVSRRSMLRAGIAAIAGGQTLRAGGEMAAAAAQNGGRSGGPPAVKALVFDTFGTVVDWRTSVAREVDVLAKRKGVTVDGAKFADAWRAGYAPAMNRVRTGELPWTKLDSVHLMILETFLGYLGLE